ncbi:MAG: hypothetical protein ABI051_03480 [Vicinamibacterales bacterium]
MRDALPLIAVLTIAVGLRAQAPPHPASYGIAYASFAPENSELFIADADGRNARPLVPEPAWDANGSFSKDGQWVVFTSNRQGSADIFRAHPDGTGLEPLTTDPAFDDQAVLSPDGTRLAFVSTRTARSSWPTGSGVMAMPKRSGISSRGGTNSP